MVYVKEKMEAVEILYGYLCENKGGLLFPIHNREITNKGGR